jgi:1,2-diacylglycerol 3-alpha-glucosyltransferase
MKIVHLCLGCFYPDNFSYQENMLPKFHKELGYEVEVIASLVTFDKNGKGALMPQGCIYQNEYDIKVTRLNYKKPTVLYKKLKRYIGTYHAIENSNPDIIFIHGCQFMDIDIVVKYLKYHPNVRVYVDNHADFSNSATNWMSKNILHKRLWKICAHLIEPYTIKFYGVLPARVDFLVNVYRLPEEKCELLVMGADDDLVKQAKNSEVIEEIREKFGISSEDFLITTGGKIDKWKTQTFLLIQAVKKINNPKVKLIVFGSVVDEYKKEMNTLCNNNGIFYIGWIEPAESYRYFASSELVVFPGRHSVFWEQVAGQGIPMLVKKWAGTTHIDFEGNVSFIDNDSIDEIAEKLKEIINDNQKYKEMKQKAEEISSIFSYKDISRRSIEI